jgi:hypothetical protein
MHDFQGLDRRRTTRRDVDIEGTLGAEDGLRLLNVGPRGIEAETAERLMVGADYTFHVPWEGERLELRGTVRWSRLDRTAPGRRGELRPVYRSGIEAGSPSIPVLEKMLGGGEG